MMTPGLTALTRTPSLATSSDTVLNKTRSIGLIAIRASRHVFAGKNELYKIPRYTDNSYCTKGWKGKEQSK